MKNVSLRGQSRVLFWLFVLACVFFFVSPALPQEAQVLPGVPEAIALLQESKTLLNEAIPIWKTQQSEISKLKMLLLQQDKERMNERQQLQLQLTASQAEVSKALESSRSASDELNVVKVSYAAAKSEKDAMEYLKDQAIQDKEKEARWSFFFLCAFLVTGGFLILAVFALIKLIPKAFPKVV